MAKISELKGKINSAEQLLSVVKTMKALASVNIHHYQRAVESLADYVRTIELGLQVLMRDREERIAAEERVEGAPFGAIVFGSDMGMVGQFNDQIAHFAVQKLEEMGIERERRAIIALGQRAVFQLASRDQPVEEVFRLPKSPAGTTAVLRDVLIHIDRWREERQVQEIVLFHHRPISGSAYEPSMHYLLPLDLEWLASLREKPWPTKKLPIFTMDWEELFSELLRSFFFVLLYRAFVDSMASENASRLQSMESAESNIEDRLGELRKSYHQARQNSITMELLDIISGFEALTGGQEG